ncbi:hypothetical protein L3081_06320 [Colwellia sp. MSW7]|uniref:Uncharacterized protein n=1 Tax=Colwellia maritima TaxID=2912588 RepID=A0ABS9WYL3_9GAMM|nr:hypothetical protein [Colwellia maritima]MCI2283083.1 hypothetical protein [Colwellia maritima]
MTDYKKSDKSGEAETIVSDFHMEEDDHFSFSDYKVEDWLAFILFWLLAITVFAQFMSRYIFESPLGFGLKK